MKKLLLIIFCISLSSCTKKPKIVELNLYLSEVVPNLDPHVLTDRTSLKIVKNIYEGLYSYHYLKRPLEIEPVLADGMPEISSDGLTYTIKLKKGVYFTDNPCFKNSKGRELVANDFIYSIKRFLLMPNTKGKILSVVFSDVVDGVKEFIDSSNESSDIKGIKQINNYTLEFKLIKKSSFFPSVLTRPNAFIIPKEAVDFYKDKLSSNPVGTGPFTLELWEPKTKAVLKKNPNYNHYKYPNEGTKEDIDAGLLKDAGKKLPFVDKVNLYILPEEQPRWLNFVRENIDIVEPDKDSYFNAFPLGELSNDLKTRGIKVVKSSVLDLSYYAFNLEKSILKNNKKLRQAMYLAYNVQKHNSLFYNNNAIIAHGLIPPGLFGYDASFTNPYHDYNVQKAKKLLAEAGYPEGKGLPKFKFLIRETIASRQMGEFFAKSMSRIGIKVELVGLNFRDLLNEVYNSRNFDIASLRWRADIAFAEDYLRLLSTSALPPGPNHSTYSNPKYDDLYKKITEQGTVNGEKLKLIEDIRKIYIEDCPLLLLIFPVNLMLTQNYIENFKLSPILEDSEYKFIKINTKVKDENTL